MIVYNYACALSRDGQIDSAIKYLNMAVNIEPDARPLTDPDLSCHKRDQNNGLILKTT